MVDDKFVSEELLFGSMAQICLTWQKKFFISKNVARILVLANISLFVYAVTNLLTDSH